MLSRIKLGLYDNGGKSYYVHMLVALAIRVVTFSQFL